MIDLDEAKFEKVFNTAVINLGFEEAILKIMYPFFEKIGVLWQIGTINPAQEHFISSLLRQKLIVAIDGVVDPLNGETKSFLLFLPEGEYHELGLIYYHYLVRKNHHKVYYLGESVPYDGLVEISKLKKIDYLLTSFVTAIPEDDAISYLNKLSKQFDNTKIYITGLQAKNFTFDLPNNVEMIENVHEFKNELAKIS